MLKGFIAAASLLSGTSALAEPAYLHCVFPGERASYPIDLVADEASGSVALSLQRTGYNERFRAIFNKDDVTFGNRLNQFTLNRVNLSVVRATPILKMVETGQCELQQAPKRAF